MFGMFDLGKRVRGRSFIEEGDAARDRRDWEAASDAYSQALAENPNLPAIQVQYGHALKEGGRLDEAIEAYRKATKQAPESADGFLQLGHALKLGGDRTAAVAAYQKSLLLDPTLRDARRELRALNAAIPKPIIQMAKRITLNGSDVGSNVCFDVSDLLHYFYHSRTPTGIQRVQMNVVESSLKVSSEGVGIQVVAFSGEGNYWVELDPTQFLDLCQLARTGAEMDDPLWQSEVEEMRSEVSGGHAFQFHPNSVLINLGTSWWLQNYFLMIRNAKEKYGIKYLPFVHDCIPIITPEHCIKELTQDFISWMAGVFHHADGFIVNSRSTAEDLKFVARIIGHSIDEPTVVYLDGKFDAPMPATESPLRKLGKDREPFVLFVSTVESRKNHALCFEAWLQLIKSRGLEKTPNLVCVGKQGWLVDAALARRESSELLKKKVILLSGISDGDLAKLYGDCLFTVYPSSYEGWGLPVTEALNYGKVPLISSTSSLPEAGGDFALYFDLHSQCEFSEKLEELIENVNKRTTLERKIADNFHPRDWSVIADEIRTAALATRSAKARGAAVGTIRLGQFERLSRNMETVIWEQMPTGERFRVGTGWNFPDDWGCWMSEPEAELAFRIPTFEGHSSNLLLITSIRGLPAGSMDAKFAIEAIGTGVWRESEVRSGEEIQRVLSIPVHSLGDDQLIRIRFSSDVSCDLSTVTNGLDRRVVTLGVAGFLACWEHDVISRQRFLEAVQFNDMDLLVQKPQGAGDYAKYRRA